MFPNTCREAYHQDMPFHHKARFFYSLLSHFNYVCLSQINDLFLPKSNMMCVCPYIRTKTTPQTMPFPYHFCCLHFLCKAENRTAVLRLFQRNDSSIDLHCQDAFDTFINTSLRQFSLFQRILQRGHSLLRIIRT